MSWHWHLRETTSNRKLGPRTSVVTIGRESCPSSCPLKGNGCYAESGPLAIHWRRVTGGNAGGIRGYGPESLAEAIRDWSKRNRGALIRIGDAGQVTDENGRIHPTIRFALFCLEREGNRAIVYCHETGNPSVIDSARAWRGTAGPFNVSRHGLIPYDPEVPLITTVPEGTFAEGRRKVGDVVQCPAEYQDTDCDRCRLCSRGMRRCVVGFTAHGVRKGKVSEVSR